MAQPRARARQLVRKRRVVQLSEAETDLSKQHDEAHAHPIAVPPNVAERENEAATRVESREVQVLDNVDERETRHDTATAENQADMASTDAETVNNAVAENADRDAEAPMVSEDEVDIASADSMDASDPPSFVPTTSCARIKR